jgi:hypothetical protein
MSFRPSCADMRVRPDAVVQLQGFPSKPRTASDGGLLASADAAEAAKAEELRRGLLSLSFAWVGSWNVEEGAAAARSCAVGSKRGTEGRACHVGVMRRQWSQQDCSMNASDSVLSKRRQRPCNQAPGLMTAPHDHTPNHTSDHVAIAASSCDTSQSVCRAWWRCAACTTRGTRRTRWAGTSTRTRRSWRCWAAPGCRRAWARSRCSAPAGSS